MSLLVVREVKRKEAASVEAAVVAGSAPGTV